MLLGGRFRRPQYPRSVVDKNILFVQSVSRDARAYGNSPRLAGRIGRPQQRDEASLGYLLDLMDEDQSADLPSLGVSGEIRVRPEQRPEFMADLKTALQDLFTKYGGADGDAFRLAVACYPDRHEPTTTPDPDSRQG